MQISSLLNPGERIRHWGFGNLVHGLTRRAGLPKSVRYKIMHGVKASVAPVSTIRRKALAKGYPADPQVARQGYRIFKPGELPGTAEIAKACWAHHQSMKNDIEALPATTFTIDLLAPGGPSTLKDSHAAVDLDAVPGLLQFALSEAVLNQAIGYLGAVPQLSNITLYASIPNQSMVGSQLYHCDQGDERIFKCIIAVSDITVDHGPFTFIGAEGTEAVARKFGPIVGRLSDEQVHSVTRDEVPLICKQGAALFIDTSRCLHFGSRGNMKTRVLLEIQFRPSLGMEGVWQCANQPYDASAADTEITRLVLAGGRPAKKLALS